MKFYSSFQVANQLIDLAAEDGKILTNRQLQDLVFIAHATSMKERRRPLIKENIRAGYYGPVVYELNDALEEFGEGKVYEKLEIAPANFEESDLGLIEYIYIVFGSRPNACFNMLSKLECFKNKNKGELIYDEEIGRSFAELLTKYK